jgi:hypothetical protein
LSRETIMEDVLLDRGGKIVQLRGIRVHGEMPLHRGTGSYYLIHKGILGINILHSIRLLAAGRKRLCIKFTSYHTLFHIHNMTIQFS